MRTMRSYEVEVKKGSVRRVHAAGVTSALALAGWKPEKRGDSAKVLDVTSREKYTAFVGEKGLEVRHGW